MCVDGHDCRRSLQCAQGESQVSVLARVADRLLFSCNECLMIVRAFGESQRTNKCQKQTGGSGAEVHVGGRQG